MKRMGRVICAAAIGVGLAPGCDLIRPDFARSLPTTLDQVDEIRNNEEFSAQQKRQALEDLDLPPQIVNALLREERTANQFGGDLRSAWEKVSGDRYTELTPDEVQLYADAGNQVNASVPFDLTDEVAQAIVDLFREQDISGRAELEAFLAGPANEVPAAIPEGDLEDIFINLDPNSLVDRLP